MNLFSELFGVFNVPEIQWLTHILFVTSPLWIPIILAAIFFIIWVEYVRADFIHNQKYVLLELKLPPEVYKSPLAMELVLSALHQTGGESTWYARYFQGKMRAWHSLELASFEGNVHMYIWTRESLKNLVEAQFYGQYPNIEITEVPDYTDLMPYYDKEKFGLWGCNFKLSKEDAYPIKTYVDYGMDRDPKEELKVDPLTPVLEQMSLIGKGEYMWIQIIFRAHKEKAMKDVIFGKTTWQKEGRQLIKKIYDGTLEELSENGNKKKVRRPVNKSEEEVIKAIERSISKHGFDVGIRGIYFGNGSDFKSSRIAGFTHIFKQFGSPTFEDSDKENKLFGLNSFSPTKTTDFDYPWQDFMKIRELKNRKKIVDAYRRRSFFYPPYNKIKPFVLNSEELATIFHPIGTVLQSPTVERVSSRKAEAPTNLPR